MPAALALTPASTPVSTMPYGQSFEDKVITLLLTSTRFGRMTQGALQPEHFLDMQNRVIAEHVLEYIEKYRQLIDIFVLINHYIIPDKRVTSGEHADYIKRVVEHHDRAVFDGKFVEDKLLEWAREQALLQINIDAPRLIAAHRVDELNRRWKRAMAIGEDQATEEIDYFATAELRKDRRNAIALGTIKRGVPTGWTEVDKHIAAGGWERRGLTIILAPTKRGKTAFMLQSALQSSTSFGSHALYISLEVSEDVATDRLDAALTGIPIDDLAARSSDVAAQVGMMASSPLRGSLWFVRRPTNTLTPAGLEAIIERHLDQGRKLDVVFVDYMGIMKTDPSTRYEDLGHIAKELRRIADIYGVAIVTGYQTNRDGLGKAVSGADSMGDSFVPAQDCDLMLSINADEAEIRAGVRRIYWALTRNEAQVTIKVQSDLSKGRLIDSIIGVVL